MVERTQSGRGAGHLVAAGLRRSLALGLMALAWLLIAWPDATAPLHAQGAARGHTGLPLPRFVSLKSDKVNVRRGPGRDYGVAWIYARAGLPVEITAEFENWRRVRDMEGEEGWVFHSLLSGGRTALISPWSGEDLYDLYRRPDRESPVVARLAPKVVVDVTSCDGDWCHLQVQGVSGWISQTSIWGVYPNERVDD